MAILSEMFTRRLHSAFDGRMTRAHCRCDVPAGGTSAANY